MPVDREVADHRERYRWRLIDILRRNPPRYDDDDDSIITTASDEIRNTAMSRISTFLRSRRESLLTADTSANSVGQRPGTALFNFLSSPTGDSMVRLALAYRRDCRRTWYRRNFPAIQRWARHTFHQMEYEDQTRLDNRLYEQLTDQEQRIARTERWKLIEKIEDSVKMRCGLAEVIDRDADIFEQHKESMARAHDAYTKSLSLATDRERDSAAEALCFSVSKALRTILKYHVSTPILSYC